MQDRARFLASILSHDAEIVGFHIDGRNYTEFFVEEDGEIRLVAVHGCAGSYIVEDL